MAFGGSTQNSGTTLTLTGVTAGATILVYPVDNAGAATAFSVNDGSAYTAVGGIIQQVGQTSTQGFILTNVGAGTHTITLGATTDTIFGGLAAWWTGFGGVDNAGAAHHERVITTTGTGANILDPGALTTSTASALVICVSLNNGSAQAMTAGTSPNGFTSDATGSVGGAVPFLIEEFVLSAAGSITPTAGISVSSSSVLIQGIALAPAGGADTLMGQACL